MIDMPVIHRKEKKEVILAQLGSRGCTIPYKSSRMRIQVTIHTVGVSLHSSFKKKKHYPQKSNYLADCTINYQATKAAKQEPVVQLAKGRHHQIS